jgi:hypothetical protein
MPLIRERFNEESSGFIRGQIVDQNGDPVLSTDLTLATLTLWDLETGSANTSPRQGVINDRDAQDILASSDVTYEADGYFRWDVQPEDNIIITSRRQIERHRALLIFGWATGQITFEVEIEVMNLRKVA